MELEALSFFPPLFPFFPFFLRYFFLHASQNVTSTRGKARIEARLKLRREYCHWGTHPSSLSVPLAR